MGLTTRAGKLPTPAKSRPLPTTRQLLDAHYLPPEPGGRVAELEAAAALLRRRIAAIIAERDQLDAELVDNRRRTIDAAVAGDDEAVGTELAAGAQLAATIVAIGHELVVASDAADQLGYMASHTRLNDPAYVAWHEQCNLILARWQQANAIIGGEARWEDRLALRERSLQGFAMQAAAELDGLAVTW